MVTKAAHRQMVEGKAGILPIVVMFSAFARAPRLEKNV